MTSFLKSPSSYCEFKARGRDAAYRFKNGSPQFKEVLRMRCHKRVKQDRGKIMNLLRNLPNDELQNVLSDTIRDEVMDIVEAPSGSMDGDSEEEFTIEKEEETVQKEAETRLMECYELLLEEYLEAILAEPPACWCPLCQRGSLALIPDGEFVCMRCAARLPAHGCTSLSSLGTRLIDCSQRHEKICACPPQFLLTTAEEGGHLLAVCSNCSTVETVL
ncbi:uncharacterized protein LOC126271666 [Schistocerca gregaria]|uniref:uncharacterized protein LOC126271666 n=1 Tax=Schistocerca gregaria TaxID=7010 RepID=UPI00211EE19E|nr:uncharacterized protein LOC126271666 [Schistocerca gregaria]